MDRRYSSRIFYLPPVAPERELLAIEFLRSVHRAYHVPSAHRQEMWRASVKIGGRLLATGWRYSLSRPGHEPFQFIRPFAAKTEAKAFAQAIRQRLAGYQVPQATQRQYCQELFVLVIVSLHELVAKLQVAARRDDGRELH